MAAAAEDIGSQDKPASDNAKSKVKFESELSRSEAIAYFEAILAGLRERKLHFKQGDKHLTITPADTLTVEVKASRKGQRERISFELGWDHSESGEHGAT